jgi:hypothetical protein
MGKTTFSGPVQSMNGFIDANGDPIGETPATPDAGDVVTTAEIAEGTISIASGSSVQAALQALAEAIAALQA